MNYEIKITNTYKRQSISKPKDFISPLFTYIPDDCVQEYISDVSRSDGGFISIPLYNRQQYANIPPSSILTLFTDNSSEAVYFQNLYIDNGKIEVTESGGGSKLSAVKSDVNFYDCDGLILYSYTTDEFLTLTSMPENSSQEGLIAQGWNLDLTEAKEYVEKYGKLDIGQSYTTDNGKTRLYITLSDGRTSPILRLTLAGSAEVDIDWGDETEHETLSGTGDVTSNRHEYASSGSYTISITVNSGSVTIPQYVLSNGDSSSSSPNKAYLNAIKKVEIGSGVVSISNYAFQYCYSLISITIPNTVTSIGSSAFSNCYSLTNITIPGSVTSIATKTFSSCYSLSSITLPDTVTSIESQAFNDCQALTSITIPSNVTIIDTGMFSSCHSLSSVTMPDTITSIGKTAFSSCYALQSITIPNSVTDIGEQAFSGCQTISYIILPDTLESMGTESFKNCYSLSSITIPSNVETIGSNAFNGCSSLATITILGKSSGEITGSPWGASTSSPTNTQIIWEN